MQTDAKTAERLRDGTLGEVGMPVRFDGPARRKVRAFLGRRAAAGRGSERHTLGGA
jgi:hypothetical protein